MLHAQGAALAHLWKLALDIDVQETRLAARSVSYHDDLDTWTVHRQSVFSVSRKEGLERTFRLSWQA